MAKKKNKAAKTSTIRKKAKPLSPELSQLMQKAFSLHKSNMLDGAKQLYLQILQKRPDYPDANFLFGTLLFESGRILDSEQYLETAYKLSPNSAPFANALGVCYLHLKKHAEAEMVLERLTKLSPNDLEAALNLGIAQLENKRFYEALANFEKVLKVKPKHGQTLYNKGHAHLALCQIKDALDSYRSALQFEINPLVSASNIAFLLNYIEDLSAEQVYEEHLALGKRFPSCDYVYPEPSKEKKRIKIGYISADFKTHSVAYFLMPLLANHNKSEFEIFCYYNGNTIDSTTEAFQDIADHWEQVSDLKDNDLVDLIRQQQLDIIVDLSGHTSHNRLNILARRVAPIQLTWLGYPHSTGLKEVDFRIVDNITDPIGEAEKFSSEQLVRLADSFICYQGNEEIDYEASLPSPSNGHITFGSFNNLAKVNESVIRTWIEILQSIPNAHMIIKAKQLSDSKTLSSYKRLFTEAGIDNDRVELLATTPDLQSHLALYNKIDVALDTFPYNGTTTTCEAMWMGVPTITISGDRHASRVGASIMTNTDASEFIARDIDHYKQLAKFWANNTQELADKRAKMRSKMRNSPLCDAPSFTKNLEETYKSLRLRTVK